MQFIKQTMQMFTAISFILFIDAPHLSGKGCCLMADHLLYVLKAPDSILAIVSGVEKHLCKALPAIVENTNLSDPRDCSTDPVPSEI